MNAGVKQTQGRKRVLPGGRDFPGEFISLFFSGFFSQGFRCQSKPSPAFDHPLFPYTGRSLADAVRTDMVLKMPSFFFWNGLDGTSSSENSFGHSLNLKELSSNGPGGLHPALSFF